MKPGDHRGFTVWLTGLSGSGKTTIANLLDLRIEEIGLKVEVLDGDSVRMSLSKGLGFTREDRDENVKRIGYVCKLLSRNDVVAIAAVVSPYRQAREQLKNEIERFVEVYVRCPIEVCKQRDVKGLYKKVMLGELQGFTGISDPYEEPTHPDLIVESDRETPQQSVEKILSKLKALGYLGSHRD